MNSIILVGIFQLGIIYDFMILEVPLQPVDRTTVEQALSLQPMVYPGGENLLTSAHGGAHGGTVGLKETAAHGDATQEQTTGQYKNPWRQASTGAGSVTVTAAYGRPHLKQSIPEGWTHMVWIHTGAGLIELQSVERTVKSHIGSVWERLHCV